MLWGLYLWWSQGLGFTGRPISLVDNAYTCHALRRAASFLSFQMDHWEVWMTAVWSLEGTRGKAKKPLSLVILGKGSET